jgi:hypothetical protein
MTTTFARTEPHPSVEALSLHAARCSRQSQLGLARVLRGEISSGKKIAKLLTDLRRRSCANCVHAHFLVEESLSRALRDQLVAERSASVPS